MSAPVGPRAGAHPRPLRGRNTRPERGTVGSAALPTSPIRVPRRARPGANRAQQGQVDTCPISWASVRPPDHARPQTAGHRPNLRSRPHLVLHRSRTYGAGGRRPMLNAWPTMKPEGVSGRTERVNVPPSPRGRALATRTRPEVRHGTPSRRRSSSRWHVADSARQGHGSCGSSSACAEMIPTSSRGCCTRCVRARTSQPSATVRRPRRHAHRWEPTGVRCCQVGGTSRTS